MANFIIQYGNKQKELTADTSSITLETNGLYMENDLVFTKGDAEEYTLTYNGQTHTFAENTTLTTADHIMATDLQVSATFVTDTNFLTFESENSFNLQFNSSAYTNTETSFMEYKVPGEDWQILAPGTLIYARMKETKYMLYLRGTGFQKISPYTTAFFAGSAIYIQGSNVRCIGEIETLLDHTTVAQGNYPEPAKYAFTNLFYGCSALTQAPSLNSKTIKEGIYSRMFMGCTSLVNPPALPATTLASYCYSEMFSGCSVLESAPALLASKLRAYCYQGMFAYCKQLQNPPSVSNENTTSADGCCACMFLGCTRLTATPAFHFTGSGGTQMCMYMFDHCTQLTTINIQLIQSCGYNNAFWGMFRDCTSLKQLLRIHPETRSGTAPVAPGKYSYMYAGCRAMYISISASSFSANYKTYRIPNTGTLHWGLEAQNGFENIFQNTASDTQPADPAYGSSSATYYVDTTIDIVG